MTVYLIITNGEMHKIIIEYFNSIKNKIPDSKVILFPDQMVKKIINTDIYIFFGIEYTKYPHINLENIYYINLEQLTVNGKNIKYDYLKNILNFCDKNKKCNILDYSKANTLILSEYNINSRYIPYQVNYNEIVDYEKIYNFAVCSTFNIRVNNIYSKISKKINKCIFLGNPPAWGIKRDNVLFRTKVIANIHYNHKNYNILEEIRITRCILNKVIVISEYSFKYEEYPLHNYIIFCEYNKMEEKIEEVLNNYEKYYNEIYNNLNIKDIDNILTKYITTFLLDNKITI